MNSESIKWTYFIDDNNGMEELEWQEWQLNQWSYMAFKDLHSTAEAHFDFKRIMLF